jgi:hypothetical protein
MKILYSLLRLIYTSTPFLIVFIFNRVYQLSPEFEYIWLLKNNPVLSAIIFNLIIFIFYLYLMTMGRKSRNTLGSLELRLRESVEYICSYPRIKGSRKIFKRQNLEILLSPILGILLSRIFMNSFFGDFPGKFHDEIEILTGFFLVSIIAIYMSSVAIAEIRENGIIYGIFRVHWSQVYDYCWDNKIGILNTLYIPKGYAILKVSYKGFIGSSSLSIIIPESLQSDVNQVFASKLPPQACETIMIPTSGWNLGSPSKINYLGITNNYQFLAWDEITTCQWRELRDCRSLMSWYLSLRKQQKYRILQVEWGITRRPRHTEIAVPSNLVEEVNKQLIKYLPTHIQIQQFPK